MLKDSLNSYFISACFGDKYIDEKPEEVVKQYTENYISEYRRDLEPMYAEDEKKKEDESSIGAWYSYYKGIESHVQLYDKDLLVYRIDYNEYTGGAHGIYMATFLNMDLTLMRPLRLDDIFVGDYKDTLTDLIWKPAHGGQQSEHSRSIGRHGICFHRGHRSDRKFLSKQRRNHLLL